MSLFHAENNFKELRPTSSPYSHLAQPCPGFNSTALTGGFTYYNYPRSGRKQFPLDCFETSQGDGEASYQ